MKYFTSLLLVLQLSCSFTDNVVPDPDFDQLVISEIDYQGQRIEFFNGSEQSITIEDYILCINGSNCQSLRNLSVTFGSLILLPQEYLVVSHPVADFRSDGTDISLYTPGGMQGDPASLFDYVRYGDGLNGDEVTADFAGKWILGTFVLLNLARESLSRTQDLSDESSWAGSILTLGFENIF